MAHGDAFLAVGDKAAIDELKKVPTDAYKAKCEILGDGGSEASESRVPNRIIRRTDSGLLMEADPRLAEMAIQYVD